MGSRFGHLPRKPFSQGGGVGQVVTAMRAIVSRNRAGSMDPKFGPVDSIFRLGRGTQLGTEFLKRLLQTWTQTWTELGTEFGTEIG